MPDHEPRAAIFLDRDGVINDPVVRADTAGRAESPLDPADVRLVPGVPAALRSLHDAGYLLVVVSNQPGYAKGEASAEDLEAVHSRVVALLHEQGIRLDAFFYCLHHPDAVVASLRKQCDCRKPRPGMLLEAAREHDIDLGRSWMVGDTDADVGAARNAGVRSVLVEHPASAHRRGAAGAADAEVRNLEAATTFILAEG